MDSRSLPPETARLWRRLRAEPLLRGFVLVGGTALAMRIGHRSSEDLDFAYVAGQSLPRRVLDRLRAGLSDEGWNLASLADQAALQDVIDAGLDLEDRQQDYSVDDAVRLSFVRLRNNATSLLAAAGVGPLRVASLDEIFATRVLAAAERSRSRDWFDLYILMARHGYRVEDLERVCSRIGEPQQYDIVKTKLLACKPSAADEGYEHLLEDAPTPAQMSEFFAGAFNEFERMATVARIARERSAR
jgi:predicted nucleotidyltransferase component of viral defense system